MRRPSSAGTATCLIPGLVTLWLAILPLPLAAVEITWSGEARSMQTFEPESAPWMTRLRSRADAALTPWLRATTEAQYSDAALCSHRREHSNVDLRLAFIEVGRETGLRVRAGRQELTWGDESLLGADAEWDNRGQVFDAARVLWTQGTFEVQAFAGALVDQVWDRVDRPRRGREIAGVIAAYRGERLEVEPFLLHKHVADSNREFATAGARVALPKLAPRLSAEATAMAQNGEWAGAASLGLEISSKLSMVGGLKLASRNFDDLFPASYNGCGLLDPYPWSDVTDITVALDYSVTRSLRIASEWHAYTRRGARAGSQWNGMVQKGLGGGLRVAAGLALRSQSPQMPQGPSAYLLVARTFGGRGEN